MSVAPLTSQQIILAAYVALAVAIVIWDVITAARVDQLRRAPGALAAITAFAGLLLLPALVVTVSESSIIYGRAIQTLGWLWPVVTLLFVMQAALALGRQLVSPIFGFPVLAYDLIVAAVAIGRYMTSGGMQPPVALLVLSAAQAGALGVLAGAVALSQARWLLVPLLSPPFPARSRWWAGVRVILAAGATVLTGLVLIEVPTASEAIRSYSRYAAAPLQERPAADFDLGLKIFPDLRGAPPPLAIANDLALSDSLDVDAVAIVVAPEAARGIALDSLARILEGVRGDSTAIVIALGYSRDAGVRFRRSPDGYTTARLADVDRIARRIRPDILIPAVEPYGEGERMLGVQPPEYWTSYLNRAARLAHYVNPNIRVAVAASSYGRRDSTLYAWAASRASPVDIVGFSLLPSFDGVSSLDTHLRIAQRWMRQFPTRPKPNWVWAAGGYPVAHGEQSQERAIRGVLSWATSQPDVKGLVISEAGDYDALRGLRAPGGRLRPAVAALRQAIRELRETAAQ